jgi:hypothetical protein
MRKINKIIILFLPVLLIYSCSAYNNASIVDKSIGGIKQNVNINANKLLSLDAEGNLTIETKDMNNSGSFTLSIVKPDSLYLYLQGPLGISIAQILLTRKDFIYYNIRDNIVYKGPSSRKNIRIVMKVDMDFDEVMNAFSGKSFFKDTNSVNDSLVTEDNNYVITSPDSANKEIRKFWINSDNYYVTKFIKLNNVRKETLIIEYSDYYKTESIYFPNTINISKPLDKQYIWLNYTSKSFNNEKLDYKLKIPKSARIIIWD